MILQRHNHAHEYFSITITGTYCFVTEICDKSDTMVYNGIGDYYQDRHGEGYSFAGLCVENGKVYFLGNAKKTVISCKGITCDIIEKEGHNVFRLVSDGERICYIRYFPALCLESHFQKEKALDIFVSISEWLENENTINSFISNINRYGLKKDFL